MGSIYAVWLIYAAGLDYLIVSIVFLSLGIPVYIWARKERGLSLFTKREAVAAVILALVAVVAIILVASGKMSL